MTAHAEALASATVSKLIATLTARAALAGAVLVQIDADDGGAAWVLSHGALTARYAPEQLAHLEAAVMAVEANAHLHLQCMALALQGDLT